jgi:hypothetical protein
VRSRNDCCCGRAIGTKYSECVSAALVIQHAKYMRRIILPYVALMALPCFFTVSHKMHDFRKKNVFWFYLQFLPETSFILRRIKQGIIFNVHTSSCKLPIIFVRYYWKFNFLDRFLKKYSILNIYRIHPMGAELFHEDGLIQPDMTNPFVAFRNFANAHKNCDVGELPNSSCFWSVDIYCWKLRTEVNLAGYVLSSSQFCTI